MLTLEGKRAIVCGSTQGIGRACAEEMAKLGASITLVARHQGGLDQVREQLPRPGGQQHHCVQADFADAAGVGDAVAAHVNEHGPVHVVVNNTGGPPAGPAITASAEEYLRGFEMHLLCNQMLAQVCAPGMRDAGYGRIINIISTSVITPIKGLGVSNTIRGAVANWAKTLAAELGPYGITVNNILPGFTATTRLTNIINGKAERAGISTAEVEEQMKGTIPARRFADPAEVGAVAAFLASPAAAYVNGVNLPVDGGRLAAQ